MKEGVVTEIAELAERAAIEHKDPFTQVHLGRTYLFEPESDGTYKREDLGGPGVGPVPLVLHTLTGLVTYLLQGTGPGSPMGNAPLNRDGGVPEEVFVHVVDHEHVVVGSPLDEEKNAYRVQYATAAFQPLIGSNGVQFGFGRYLDLETFNIALQTLFADSHIRARLLHITGTVRDEMVKTSTDDGVTQKVIASAGVVGAYETDVPNPVELTPFRTFREVPQPASIFVLRLKKGENGMPPTAALFEADGGKWKLEAIENIATFLRDKLPGVTILA